MVTYHCIPTCARHIPQHRCTMHAWTQHKALNTTTDYNSTIATAHTLFTAYPLVHAIYRWFVWRITHSSTYNELHIFSPSLQYHMTDTVNTSADTGSIGIFAVSIVIMLFFDKLVVRVNLSKTISSFNWWFLVVSGILPRCIIACHSMLVAAVSDAPSCCGSLW